jgi:hypothetical protein
MPLSPLVSADVPAVSVAVQGLVSGLPPPFSSDCTSELNHRIDSRRF